MESVAFCTGWRKTPSHTLIQSEHPASTWHKEMPCGGRIHELMESSLELQVGFWVPAVRHPELARRVNGCHLAKAET